ncbi:MAG: universal stress protein [Hyphomonas sp.]|uniref:universal stress protein n=1 Tax=Hyphomonas sp. TaxID=87 RepID=UPI00352945C1
MTVVAMLQGAEAPDRAVTLDALALAQRLNVPVRGVCALPDPNAAMIVMSTPEATGLAASATRDLAALQDKIVAGAKDIFDDVTSTGAHGLACTFTHEVNIAERAGANAATLADAVVFPHSSQKSTDPLGPSFEHVLMEARLPLVLSGTRPIESGPVVIAWDGSNGAARAIRFHLDLVKAFGAVVIAQSSKDLEKDDHRASADPTVLEDWLSAHGISAQRMPIEGEVASGLLSLAKQCDASMIVAGAYGHSRIGERLFGGTTRNLLEASDAPALALAR